MRVDSGSCVAVAVTVEDAAATEVGPSVRVGTIGSGVNLGPAVAVSITAGLFPWQADNINVETMLRNRINKDNCQRGLNTLFTWLFIFSITTRLLQLL